MQLYVFDFCVVLLCVVLYMYVKINQIHRPHIGDGSVDDSCDGFSFLICQTDAHAALLA